MLAASALAGCVNRATLGPEARGLYDGALDLWLSRTIQLQTINQKLRAAGVGICGDDVAPVLGIAVTRTRELPDTLRGIGQDRFQGRPELVVLAVIDGFPAEQVGIQRGDRILRVRGERAIGSASVHSPRPTNRRTIQVRIARGDRKMDLQLDNWPGCRIGARLVNTDAFNAYATPREVLVCSGLMRILRTDEAIAFVMGHEMAHHIRTTAWWGDKRLHGVEAEERADYLGAYFASLAGYRLEEKDFGLARPAYADPNRLTVRSATHPSSPRRLIEFRKTLREIGEKRRIGLPLKPEEG